MLVISRTKQAHQKARFVQAPLVDVEAGQWISPCIDPASPSNCATRKLYAILRAEDVWFLCPNRSAGWLLSGKFCEVPFILSPSLRGSVAVFPQKGNLPFRTVTTQGELSGQRHRWLSFQCARLSLIACAATLARDHRWWCPAP